MRVILDTNVIVSSILSATGASRAIFDLARRGQVEIVTSAVLLGELDDVLSRFMSRAAAAEVRAAVEELALVVEPEHVPEVTRDRDDDHVLAAAVAARADFIVTRDGDLLVLDTYEGISMLAPAFALEMIRATNKEDDYSMPNP